MYYTNVSVSLCHFLTTQANTVSQYIQCVNMLHWCSNKYFVSIWKVIALPHSLVCSYFSMYLSNFRCWWLSRWSFARPRRGGMHFSRARAVRRLANEHGWNVWRTANRCLPLLKSISNNINAERSHSTVSTIADVCSPQMWSHTFYRWTREQDSVMWIS